MSIVVAVQKNGQMAIASDSQSVYGRSHREDERNLASKDKIQIVGSAYLGYTGWGLYSNIFRHYMHGRKTPPRLIDEHSIFSFFLKFLKDLRVKYALLNDQANTDKDPFADLDSSFLVASRNGIYGISSNLSVCQFKQYHAIGSGCDYAFGALYALYDSSLGAEAIARAAVEAAIRFDTDCGGEIAMYTFKAARSRQSAAAPAKTPRAK